jgi:hypothetical protein
MPFNPIAFTAALAALIGFGGLLYGATGKTNARRNLGLRLLQGGMTIGGLLLIANAFILGPQDDVFGGFLLLVLGTGATAINPRQQP